METVEVVIRLPKDVYEKIQQIDRIISGRRSGRTIDFALWNGVKNGTVLQKGHGDLIDRDRLINRCLFMSNDDTAIEGMEYITKGMIKTAPTVIEADREVNDE